MKPTKDTKNVKAWALYLFDTDCNSMMWTAYDIAEWVEAICEHYNRYHTVDDFYIVSITKLGESK